MIQIVIRSLAIAGLIATACQGAHAQSSPGFTLGQVPSATDWNSYFAGKADTTNGALNSPTINFGSANNFVIGAPSQRWRCPE